MGSRIAFVLIEVADAYLIVNTESCGHKQYLGAFQGEYPSRFGEFNIKAYENAYAHWASGPVAPSIQRHR